MGETLADRIVDVSGSSYVSGVRVSSTGQAANGTDIVAETQTGDDGSFGLDLPTATLRTARVYAEVVIVVNESWSSHLRCGVG